MSELPSGPELLNAFLGQDLALEELKDRLEADLKAGASPTGWGAALEDMEARGLLPPDLVGDLRQIIEAHVAADRTVLKAGRPSVGQDDIESDSGAPTAKLSSGLGLAEPSSSPTEVSQASSMPRGNLPFRPATGSDWSRPVEWMGDDNAPIGPGTVIRGRYELESLIGEGGMGVVYRALDRVDRDARHRNPYVAIKILNEEFRKHSNAAIALHRETRKSQQLSHPNIIQVRDFDLDGSIVFMTMELLDGAPLNQLISDSNLSGIDQDEALAIIRDIAAALGHAHSKGIVHSDLKPANVFRTKDGETKVLDFGIARAVTSDLTAQGENTAFDATTLGAMTPGYASLEMRQGDAPVPADDVYALGIIAYELLTGEHPFGRMPADEAWEKELKPPPLKSLPPRQRRALERAVSFERAARPADGAAFSAELNRASPALKIATVAGFAATVAVAAYAFYSGGQLRPDVPWEALSAEQQAAFTVAIEDGQTLLGFGDGAALNESFDRFEDAYEIHRNNPEALAGLEAVADQFLEIIDTAAEIDRRGVVRKLYCQEYLSTYASVTAACQASFGPQQCSPVGLQCPSAARLSD